MEIRIDYCNNTDYQDGEHSMLEEKYNEKPQDGAAALLLSNFLSMRNILPEKAAGKTSRDGQAKQHIKSSMSYTV